MRHVKDRADNIW